jgi:hypothetical protein
MTGTALPRGNATAPCNWPVSYAGCTEQPFSDTDDPTAADDQVTFETMATTYLWEWTGRRYGTCPEVIRPCRRGCSEAVGTFWWSNLHAPLAASLGMYGGLVGGGWLPVFIQGGPAFLACGDCGMGDGCSCTYVSSIRLPGPVSSVTEVQIDGVVLDPSAYRLDGARLVRTDGIRWPNCQDMSIDPPADGTWTVAYERGLAVPTGGQVAAGILASELAKAACADSSCKLPQRLQTVTRQGVTMALLDDFKGSLDQGYTGIWVVDSWIASVTRPSPAAVVMSPDYRRPGRT